MRVKKIVAKALVVASGALLAGSVQANLIVNGGFESATVENGWSYGNEAGWEGDNVEIWDNFGAIGPYEGEKHAELNSHPYTGNSFSIYQAFSTVIGQAYNLSFAYGARSSESESFQVDITGATAMIFDDHVVNVWSTYSGDFVATASETTLKFTSIVPSAGTVGNFLDDIKVTVPEPGSLGLLAFGLIGLGMARRKAK